MTETDVVGIFLAFGIILYGLLFIVKPDWMWRLNKHSQVARGIKPDQLERSPQWERHNFRSGVMCISIGTGLLIPILLLHTSISNDTIIILVVGNFVVAGIVAYILGEKYF